MSTMVGVRPPRIAQPKDGILSSPEDVCRWRRWTNRQDAILRQARQRWISMCIRVPEVPPRDGNKTTPEGWKLFRQIRVAFRLREDKSSTDSADVQSPVRNVSIHVRSISHRRDLFRSRGKQV